MSLNNDTSRKGNGEKPPRAMTPLQAELLEEGILPQTDALHPSLERPDVAEQAGYSGDGGPEPFTGPIFDKEANELAVYQWEIDPANTAAESGVANVSESDWEFRVWWQVHPADLVYASIQAMREDWVEHAGQARVNPAGRSEAVNLVFDLKRGGVVAIYGTVRDFRPFVDAFHKGFKRAEDTDGTDESGSEG